MCVTIIYYSIHLGYYIYTEASSPRKIGDKARLISPQYLPKSNGQECVTFWFHMHGANIGSLNVYIRQSQQSDKLVWTMRGNEPDLWYYATIQVNATQLYQVNTYLIYDTMLLYR